MRHYDSVNMAENTVPNELLLSWLFYIACDQQLIIACLNPQHTGCVVTVSKRLLWRVDE